MPTIFGSDSSQIQSECWGNDHDTCISLPTSAANSFPSISFDLIPGFVTTNGGSSCLKELVARFLHTAAVATGRLLADRRIRDSILFSFTKVHAFFSHGVISSVPFRVTYTCNQEVTVMAAPSDLFPFVYSYLQNLGFNKTAKTLAKECKSVRNR